MVAAHQVQVFVWVAEVLDPVIYWSGELEQYQEIEPWFLLYDT